MFLEEADQVIPGGAMDGLPFQLEFLLRIDFLQLSLT
jgi:hypothetical protein